MVIANNASISGAEGGCQAEVGSASAMASAALVCAKNGTAHQAAQAVAITLKKYDGFDLRSCRWPRRSPFASKETL